MMCGVISVFDMGSFASKCYHLQELFSVSVSNCSRSFLIRWQVCSVPLIIHLIIPEKLIVYWEDVFILIDITSARELLSLRSELFNFQKPFPRCSSDSLNAKDNGVVLKGYVVSIKSLSKRVQFPRSFDESNSDLSLSTLYWALNY